MVLMNMKFLNSTLLTSSWAKNLLPIQKDPTTKLEMILVISPLMRAAWMKRI